MKLDLTTPLKVFIGYDAREPIAFSVLAHSILKRASRPVMICPLTKWSLQHCSIYTRERGPLESTDFALTRFLIPYLSGYTGTSIFMDCDMLCLVDIFELIDEVEKDARAVHVVKHDYVPKTETKFLGQPQVWYPRKNWSSLMVFHNNWHDCQRLTPEYVNKASPLDLHRFAWAADEQIGGIGLEWNWLVGEYDWRRYKNLSFGVESSEYPKILHYTCGGPWFGYPDDAEIWFNERDSMMKPES